MRTICSAVNIEFLEEVNVSDNAIGFKGIDSIRHLLSGKRIQRLFMCNNGMSAEAVESVAQLLLTGDCPPLKLFHFYNNMSGNGGAKAIATIIRACSELVDLRFSATRSSAEGCIAIAEAIGTLTGLTRLDLSDNAFTAKGGVALAKALKGHTQLRHLNLRDAGVEEDGVTRLCDSLSSTTFPLTFLDISGNDVTSDLMEEALIPALAHLKELEELYLDDNEIVSRVSAYAGRSYLFVGFRWSKVVSQSNRERSLAISYEAFVVHLRTYCRWCLRDCSRCSKTQEISKYPVGWKRDL